MKKLIVVLMAVVFAGVNSMALAGKGEPQTDNTAVGTKKPVNTKKPSPKKPAPKKPTSSKGGKGGAKTTVGNGTGILTNVKPDAHNPRTENDPQNGKGTANNPGL